MHATLLLGPAGSGKTHRCLTEIRSALRASPDGPPLVFLAPKQATFQLERQLLGAHSLTGYARLHILSFERLAEFVFDRLEKPLPPLLSEEGRVMVLRALLEQMQRELKLFHASARLPGFAQQLSLLLREFQRYHLSATRLEELSRHLGESVPLGRKLHDFALVLRAYLDWLHDRNLQDADQLLDVATEALNSELKTQNSKLHLAGLWLDGFAQMTPQERKLLAALAPLCGRMTLAFCLEDQSSREPPWHSLWSLVSATFNECYAELTALTDGEVKVEVIPRDPAHSRFAGQPMLQYLEQHWAQPVLKAEGGRQKAEGGRQKAEGQGTPSASGEDEAAIRVVVCANPEAEATLAAREILRFVRAGGRFRDVAVLVRQLEDYHNALRRVFTRYEIPFFLDRREPVAHHPLAELTRSALRTVAFGWKPADWFGVLKTGLVPARAEEIDRLENEALARGWEGQLWLQALKIAEDAHLEQRLERLRQKVVAPFAHLAAALGAMNHCLTGTQLAELLRTLWENLKVEQTLDAWSETTAEEASPFAMRHAPSAIHQSVWQQMQTWLDNLALAFPAASAPLPLRDWLPILDAGLSGLTVGVIPPALDQVLLGAIDRSRNPDLQQVYVLGLNETVFPGVPRAPSLLTEADREQLVRHGQALGPNQRLQLGHERYYGYIACTRARQKVVLTYARHDAEGKTLNPSAFVTQVRRLFPELEAEEYAASRDWLAGEHPSELIAPLLRNAVAPAADRVPSLSQLAGLPLFAETMERLQQLHTSDPQRALSPALAERLYGPVLETSVSRLEQFAACPFRFFVNSGLQAEERKKFEFEIREQGQFQHEVLARFHERLRREGQRWRDLTPQSASELVGHIADELLPTFQNGLMLASAQNQFLARSYKTALQRFIATLVDWMTQYRFDPAQVELGFGMTDGPLPAWELELGDRHRLAFRGRIDRVDLWRAPDADTALCVVMDYKSGARKLDPLLLEHGIQQQLPAYLNVLRRVRDPRPVFGVARLEPVGVFFVNLRGSYQAGADRNTVLAAKDQANKQAYRHEGVFDLAALRLLDARAEALTGDQFRYRLTPKDGQPYKGSAGVLPTAQFTALLDREEQLLSQMGRRIYAGDAPVDPYKKGQDTPCAKCDYHSICRIDSWTHRYRVLKSRHETSEDVP